MNAKTAAPPPPADDYKPTDLALQGSREIEVYDFGDDAGKGAEGITQDELVIPFWEILQSNSPQCEDPRQGGVAGARPGMIMNTATGELIDGDKGFMFIPVYRDHNYPEFIPRNLGGGFQGIHQPDDELVLELRVKYGKFGKLFTSEKKDRDGYPAEGTELTETYYLYGIVVTGDSQTSFPERGIVRFKSTQIKKYKGFLSRLDSITYLGPDSKPVKPPLWAHRWRVTTAGEKNKKGSFFGWHISLDARAEDGSELPLIRSLLKRSDPLYQAGRDFYDLIKSGQIKADYAGADKVGEAEAEEQPM